MHTRPAKKKVSNGYLGTPEPSTVPLAKCKKIKCSAFSHNTSGNAGNGGNANVSNIIYTHTHTHITQQKSLRNRRKMNAMRPPAKYIAKIVENTQQQQYTSQPSGRAVKFSIQTATANVRP